MIIIISALGSRPKMISFFISCEKGCLNIIFGLCNLGWVDGCEILQAQRRLEEEENRISATFSPCLKR
jgi:hypothetical protein